MEHLFSPFQIRDLHLKNRIVMPGLASFLIEDDGSVTDKTIEHYRRRAAGGPAMVILEAHSVSPEGIVSLHQARLHDDRFIEGVYRIREVIEYEGAAAAIQLHHGGRQVPARVIGQKPISPSNLPCPTIRGEVQPLTIDGIQRVINDFGDSAERAVQAGFKLIEIHGAHGYIINQFLSKFSNIREDQYGGSLVNRARFAKEIVTEVRKRVGEDFPLSFKISAQEFVPNGLTVQESIELLKEIIQPGIDILQVSAGNDATAEWICQPMFMKKACLSDSAAQIKQALQMPVMTVGRINDPHLAEDIIHKKIADLVCIGRGLLADPELPKKAESGQFDEIRSCIACNTCMESIFRKGRIECLVNPTLGREKEMAIYPAKQPKKVMVVGGGPGGLNVAGICAKRGHEVHLYEKDSELGGQLNLGAVSAFKKEILTLIEFQKRQIEKQGVKKHLNTMVTLETIQKENPDVVILATGSTPVKPNVSGIDKPIVHTLNDVLTEKDPVKKKTVVIGGGATGCEVAHHLSDQGCQVTIIEQMPKIGGLLESITKKVLIQKLKENNVQLMPGYKLSRVDEQGVVVTNEDNQETFIEAESVIVAVGNKPNNSLYEKANSLGLKVYQIGDCLQPRSAKAAIFEGAEIGREI